MTQRTDDTGKLLLRLAALVGPGRFAVTWNPARDLMAAHELMSARARHGGAGTAVR